MKKIHVFLFVGLTFLSSIFIFSCFEKSNLEPPIEENFKLVFDEISITQNSDGSHTFTEKDIEKVRKQLEDLIIGKQEVISKIDDFGIKTLEGEKINRQVLYIYEYINNQTIKGYYFLDGKGLIENINSNSAEIRANGVIYFCMAEMCCDSCEMNNTAGCFCWDIDVDCSNGGGNTQCNTIPFIVGRG